MPTPIECYKCDQCSKLLPKDSSDYLLLSNLKLQQHIKSKAWDDKSYWIRTVCEYSGDKERLFCSAGCMNLYFLSLIESLIL